MRFTYIFPAVLLASQASAAALNGLLVARQSTTDLIDAIPAQCQSACTDATTLLTRCGATDTTSAEAAACLCSSSTIAALDSCFACLIDLAAAGGAAATDAVKQQTDLIVQGIVDACSSNGTPIDGATSGGGASSSPSAAGTRTSTATGTASQSVIRPSASGTTGSQPTSGNDSNTSSGTGSLPDETPKSDSVKIVLTLIPAVAAAAGAFLLI